MGAHKQLKFKPDKYLLKEIARKFKERFGKACFRDDIARTNTAREGINMICVRGDRTMSPRESSRESTAQIALNRLAMPHRAGIGAAKKAAMRGNRRGVGGKTFQCGNRKEGSDAAKLFLTRRSNSKRGKNEKNSTTDGFVRRRVCGG